MVTSSNFYLLSDGAPPTHRAHGIFSCAFFRFCNACVVVHFLPIHATNSTPDNITRAMPDANAVIQKTGNISDKPPKQIHFYILLIRAVTPSRHTPPQGVWRRASSNSRTARTVMFWRCTYLKTMFVEFGKAPADAFVVFGLVFTGQSPVKGWGNF